MTLRFPSQFQQLLFAAGASFLLICGAAAQDIIIDAQGTARTVRVVGMSASGQTLEFLVGEGKLGLPLNQIKEVRMNPPAEFGQAFQAYQAKDYTKAQTLMKGVADKFRGMPATWAQQASGMLVDIDLALKETARAEADYAAFVKAYPAGGTLQADVLAARIAASKNNFEVAKQKLAHVTEAALKEKAVSGANALAFSQAFLVSGQVKEAEGNFNGALEDYLRTVTLFYHDRAAVGVAQERADALRSQHKDAAVP
jgi:hypothetical protein